MGLSGGAESSDSPHCYSKQLERRLPLCRARCCACGADCSYGLSSVLALVNLAGDFTNHLVVGALLKSGWAFNALIFRGGAARSSRIRFSLCVPARCSVFTLLLFCWSLGFRSEALAVCPSNIKGSSALLSFIAIVSPGKLVQLRNLRQAIPSRSYARLACLRFDHMLDGFVRRLASVRQEFHQAPDWNDSGSLGTSLPELFYTGQPCLQLGMEASK